VPPPDARHRPRFSSSTLSPSTGSSGTSSAVAGAAAPPGPGAPPGDACPVGEEGAEAAGTGDPGSPTSPTDPAFDEDGTPGSAVRDSPPAIDAASGAGRRTAATTTPATSRADAASATRRCRPLTKRSPRRTTCRRMARQLSCRASTAGSRVSTKCTSGATVGSGSRHTQASASLVPVPVSATASDSGTADPPAGRSGGSTGARPLRARRRRARRSEARAASKADVTSPPSPASSPAPWPPPPPTLATPPPSPTRPDTSRRMGASIISARPNETSAGAPDASNRTASRSRAPWAIPRECSVVTSSTTARADGGGSGHVGDALPSQSDITVTGSSWAVRRHPRRVGIAGRGCRASTSHSARQAARASGNQTLTMTVRPWPASSTARKTLARVPMDTSSVSAYPGTSPVKPRDGEADEVPRGAEAVMPRVWPPGRGRETSDVDLGRNGHPEPPVQD
jgi:hypothetical protein